jgi:hypothetical protein
MSLTKVTYSMINGPTINPVDYGASTSSSDNTAAIQAALDAAADAGGAIVQLPAGEFTIAGTLTVGSNIKFCGVSMGYGSYSSTVLKYTGSGVAIQIGAGAFASGFYSKLQGFKLINGGATAGSTVGIYIRATQTEIEDVTVMTGATVGFNDGIKTDYTDTTFTHIMRRVYVYGCGTGFYLRKVNNVVLDACFIESNNTGVFIVDATNISLVNGCVLECFGDIPRGAETATSCCIEASGVTGLTVRDWYSEVAASATTAIGQQFARLANVNGGCIDSGYMYTQGDNSIAYPLIELQDANVKNFAITNNSFNRLGTDAYVVGASGGGNVANVWVANNFYTANSYDYNPHWTPTVLIGGSSTGITYSSQLGDWWREGNSIVVSGQITLSSKGSGTGVVTVGGLPLPMQRRLNAQCFGVLMVSDATALSASQTFCRATTNSSELRLQYRLTSSANEVAYTNAELSDTSTIQFQITYPIEP